MCAALWGRVADAKQCHFLVRLCDLADPDGIVVADLATLACHTGRGDRAARALLQDQHRLTYGIGEVWGDKHRLVVRLQAPVAHPALAGRKAEARERLERSLHGATLLGFPAGSNDTMPDLDRSLFGLVEALVRRETQRAGVELTSEQRQAWVVAPARKLQHRHGVVITRAAIEEALAGQWDANLGGYLYVIAERLAEQGRPSENGTAQASPKRVAPPTPVAVPDEWHDDEDEDYEVPWDDLIAKCSEERPAVEPVGTSICAKAATWGLVLHEEVTDAGREAALVLTADNVDRRADGAIPLDRSDDDGEAVGIGTPPERSMSSTAGMRWPSSAAEILGLPRPRACPDEEREVAQQMLFGDDVLLAAAGAASPPATGRESGS